MSKSFLTPIGLFSAATDPLSASIGNIYFNSSSNVVRVYFNSQWNSLHNITASYGLDADHIDFSTNPSSAASVARLQWSPGEGTLSFGLGGGNVFLNIGQEEVALCYNGTASTLTKGTVVYISGAQGQRPRIDKASASAEGESSKTLGVVAENIASGSEGFVCTSGILRNVNTASFAEGSALWLSTTPGQMTTSKLYAPNHLVFIGYSIKQSATAGQIFIKIQNGLELYELHNVSASAPANNDILVYNTSSSLWFNSSSANLANLTVTNTINGRAASANLAITASNVLVSPSAIYADRIDFVTSPVSAASVGRMTWNATSGTVELGMDNGPSLITTLIGQSLYVKATNKDSASMTRGDVVYISGAIGQRVAIRLASASANGIDRSPIGMCAENIAVNDTGFVIVRGTISGVNTQAYTEGDAVWLSASPGKITNIRPPAPLGANVIGHVINSNIANGSINVTIIDGQKLSFLNDVVLTASTFSNNDVLAYNLSASYWENTSIQNKITTASVGYANVAGHASTASSIAGSRVTGYVASANIATHAGTASSIAGSLVSGSVFSALVATSASNANTASSINASLIAGTTLASNVVNSSLTSVGTLTNLTVTNTISGRAASANVSTHAGTASSVAGSLVTGYVASANIATHAGTASSIAGSLVAGTVSNASHANTASSINASLITGTTLPAAIVNSSLTSVGTLGSLTVSQATGRVVLQTDGGGNVNIGRTDNASSTPFIDFNSSASSVDFDVRIQVSGGNGIPGNGLLSITASQVNIDGGTFFADGSNNRVGIGTTSPNQTLTVVGTASITSTLDVGNTTNITGLFQTNRNVTAGTVRGIQVNSTNNYTTNWNAIEFSRNGSAVGFIRVASAVGAPTLETASDYRLKENIVNADINFIEKIKLLRPVYFEWKDKNMGIGQAKGFIAHEVQESIPEAVTGSKDAIDENGDIVPQTLTEQPFTFYLVGALKQALDKIDELSARIEYLESK